MQCRHRAKSGYDGFIIVNEKCPYQHRSNICIPFRDEENENMDEWDEEKLEEVVKKKHGSEKANATDIVRIFWRNIFHRLNLRIVQNSPIT